VTLSDIDTGATVQVRFIVDESGQCLANRPITVAVEIGTSDLIGGLARHSDHARLLSISLCQGAANVWIIAR
jgi:hypothetical protein